MILDYYISESKMIVMHNAPFDMMVLLKEGIEIWNINGDQQDFINISGAKLSVLCVTDMYQTHVRGAQQIGVIQMD